MKNKTKKPTLKSTRDQIRALGYSFQTILGFNNNPKTAKSDRASNYLTAIVYLQPNLKTCTYSKMAKCINPCLNTAGRGGMTSIQEVRHDRTRCYYEHRELFMQLLRLEIDQHERRCHKYFRFPAVRLNGTSDIDWSELITDYPKVQFYDYTKDLGRVRQWIEAAAPPKSWGGAMLQGARRNQVRPRNYHVTLSWSGASKVYKERCLELMALDPSLNIAMVFRDKETVQSILGKRLFDRTIVDGDTTDLRFLDHAYSIVALYAKGGARRDTSGFVVDVAQFNII